MRQFGLWSIVEVCGEVVVGGEGVGGGRGWGGIGCRVIFVGSLLGGLIPHLFGLVLSNTAHNMKGQVRCLLTLRREPHPVPAREEASYWNG